MLTCHVSVHHIWACSNESQCFHGLSHMSWNNHFSHMFESLLRVPVLQKIVWLKDSCKFIVVTAVGMNGDQMFDLVLVSLTAFEWKRRPGASQFIFQHWEKVRVDCDDLQESGEGALCFSTVRSKCPAICLWQATREHVWKVQRKTEYRSLSLSVWD